MKRKSSNSLRPETEIRMRLITLVVVFVCTVGLTITHLLDSLWNPCRLSQSVALLIEAFLTQTVRMMVPLFSTICISSSSHPLFLNPVSLQVMMEAPDDVPYIVNMNEAQETACTPIHAVS